MSLIKVNGILCKYVNPIPEIIFASDDFVTIKNGELVSTDIVSSDSHNFNLDPYSRTPFGVGVFDSEGKRNSWNSNKKYCLFSDKSAVIKCPITKLDEFSIQFYYMSDQDCGRLDYCNPYTEIFSVYNDNGWVILLSLGASSESFNGASIGTDPWSTNPTKQQYQDNGTGYVTFISIVYKRISENTFRQYFYANGVLYFAFNKTLSTDNIPITHTKHNSGSTKQCYLSEIMVFSYSRASQDMMTYPTNNYYPMYT